MTTKFALLDRDGTIIVDKVYLSNPDDIEFVPGAVEGLKLLQQSGFRLILITNQSGIARGYFDSATLERIHARLLALLAQHKIKFEAIYYCPHGPDDGCNCRKPAPGMITDAMRDFAFGPQQAVLIGDSDADMQAAAISGIQGVRINIGNASNNKNNSSNFLDAARKACQLLASY